MYRDYARFDDVKISEEHVRQMIRGPGPHTDVAGLVGRDRPAQHAVVVGVERGVRQDEGATDGNCGEQGTHQVLRGAVVEEVQQRQVGNRDRAGQVERVSQLL